jgi:hypothetical protein
MCCAVYLANRMQAHRHSAASIRCFCEYLFPVYMMSPSIHLIQPFLSFPSLDLLCCVRVVKTTERKQGPPSTSLKQGCQSCLREIEGGPSKRGWHKTVTSASIGTLGINSKTLKAKTESKN